MIFEFDTILYNLEVIGFGLILFVMCWFSNFMASLWYNIGVSKEEFSYKKLISGVLKIIALVISMGFLTLAITILPEYLVKIGFSVPDEWKDLFNVVGMLGIVITSAVTYGKQALLKISDIFKGGKK